jgi:hypothetical protein
MYDVIAPKQSSLRNRLVEARSCVLNMISILNKPIDGTETMIWTTLIPSCPKLPHDIHDSDDNETKEDDNEVEEDDDNDDDKDNDDEDDDLPPMPIENEEANYTY